MGNEGPISTVPFTNFLQVDVQRLPDVLYEG